MSQNDPIPTSTILITGFPAESRQAFERGIIDPASYGAPERHKDGMSAAIAGELPGVKNDLNWAEKAAREAYGRYGSPTPVPTTEGVQFQELSKNFQGALRAVESMFKTAFDRNLGPLQLDSIEVSFDVSTEGKVSILGSGASIHGGSGIKLSFKRPSPAPPASAGD